jgi:hypothetical protein
MAIRRGKQILQEVRRKISDESYASFSEINEAHRKILSKAPYNILRKSEIIGYGLYDDTKEYDLNIANIRSIERIWIAGSSTTDVGDIEGITLSGTDPVSVQITAHGLTDGRQVIFDNVGGTTELEDNTYKITKTDANNFTLNGTSSSNFTAWTSGGDVAVWDVDDGSWDLMTEVPALSFNTAVKNNTYQTANVTTGTVVVTTTEVQYNRVTTGWAYYLKGGDSSPFMKMVVTPTPQTTYKLKIDYLKVPSDITEEIVPDVPPFYDDMLTNLAASYILDGKDDQASQIKAAKYLKRYREMAMYLLNDLHRNRTGGVDRPAAPWKQ